MVVAPADEGAAAAEAADVPPEQQQEGVLSRIWAVAPAHQGAAMWVLNIAGALDACRPCGTCPWGGTEGWQLGRSAMARCLNSVQVMDEKEVGENAWG
eukprot:1136789-Pelagomonas_calceolata.AAC.9